MSSNVPRIANQTIDDKAAHPYLGVTLDRRLNFTGHVMAVVGKARGRIKSLNWLIGRNSKLPLRIKVMLFKQMIVPVWKYAMAVWGPLTSNTQMAKIQVIQNEALRRIVNAPWYVRNSVIHADLQIPTARLSRLRLRYTSMMAQNNSHDVRAQIREQTRMQARVLQERQDSFLANPFSTHTANSRGGTTTTASNSNNNLETSAAAAPDDLFSPGAKLNCRRNPTCWSCLAVRCCSTGTWT